METFNYEGLLIPYSKLFKKIDDIDVEKFYIIDLTNLEYSDLIVSSILNSFDNFDIFQEKVLSDIYYNDESIFRNCNNLVFKISDDLEISSMYRIVENFEYMRKFFIKESYFDQFFNDLCALRHSKNVILNMNERDYNLSNFNVLESEDKELLMSLAKFLKAPIITEYEMYQNYDERIKKVNYEKMYYYYMKLWSMPMFGYEGIPDDINRVSGTEKMMLSLASILSMESKTPLIIDDFTVNRLDTSRKLNLISVLTDYSYDNNIIVLTSTYKSVNRLIKSRVYKANII